VSTELARTLARDAAQVGRLSPREFEVLVAGLLEHAGFTVVLTELSHVEVAKR
jgi:HJR/Mrr/RecB family endonuclease